MKLCLVSYNIHKGIGGVDRRYRPERIVETIARYSPDVVMLQEVDDGVPRSGGHRQVDLFGDALGLAHRAFQRNVALRRGFYGNAILSRFPLADVQDVDLSIPVKKRRQALVARCRVDARRARDLVLVNCHLGLSGFERAVQLRRLLSQPVLVDTRGDTPVVVGGDFNDVWGTLGPRFMEPAGFRLATADRPTFPAILPLRALDHVFHRGSITTEHAFTARSRVSRDASDHLPLIVRLDVSWRQAARSR